MLQCGVGIAPGQHNQKLLAAVAADGIIAAHGGLHAPDRFVQHGVSSHVAVGVVDHLEVIQVGQDYADEAMLALSAVEFFFQDFQDRVTVPGARECVGGGLHPQRFPRRHQFGLQFDDAAAGSQADFQFVVVEGLGDVVIGTGLHAFHQVLFLTSRSEQQNVRISAAGLLPQTAADFDAGHPRHHPIQYGQARRIGML